MPAPQNIVEKVLGDPSQYPDAFKSWIQRLIPGNPLIQLDATQIPSPEKNHIIAGNAAEPVFQHGSHYGSGFSQVGFYKDPYNVVHLFGVVGPTYAASNIIAQLPSGYRPLSKEAFTCFSDTGVARVDVDEAGNIIFVSGGTGFVSLSGISFRSF